MKPCCLSLGSLEASAALFVDLIRSFLAETAGATTVIVATTLPLLLGAAAFGAEAGYWTYRQRQLQQFVDTAAFSGAVDLVEVGKSEVKGTVERSLSVNGFRADIGTVAVETPPGSGPYAGKDAVHVSAEENWPRFFSAVFFQDPVKIVARATALAQASGEACMLALDASAPSSIKITGTANVTLLGCSAVSNSVASTSFSVSGSGNIVADCASAAGGISSTPAGIILTECAAPRERIAPLPDPYADVAEPSVSGSCKKPDKFGGNPAAIHNITPGRYCGLDMKRTVNLAPGTYVIDGGDLSISSTALVNGSGVTFFLTNGATLDINGAASVNVSAPTSGPYSGLVVFADRSGTPLTHKLNGSAAAIFTGAVYMPNDHVEVRGTNAAGGGCMQMIARTLDYRGTAGLGIACDSAGTRKIEMPGRVRLVL